MESKTLYQHLLVLSKPWTVEQVDLDMAKQHVDAHVEHHDGIRLACPDCGQEYAAYDYLAEQVWLHFGSCQTLMYLHKAAART